jgi:hypothetical protein
MVASLIVSICYLEPHSCSTAARNRVAHLKMMNNLEMFKWRQWNAQEISCNISTYKCGSTLVPLSTCQNNRNKQHSFVIYYNYLVLSELLCMPWSMTNVIRLNFRLDAWSHLSNSSRINLICSHLLWDFCQLSSSLYSQSWPFLTLLPLHLKIDCSISSWFSVLW